MSWVDKVNQWVLRKVRPDGLERVELTGDGFRLVWRSGEVLVVAWEEVREVAVIRQSDMALGSYALIIEADALGVMLVDEMVPGFKELVEETDRRLDGVVPYEQWAVELIRGPGMVIYRRGDSSALP